MELYLLRHAIAVARGTAGYEDDSQRPLTPDGLNKMKRIAAGMEALDLTFDRIISSPFQRAKATAEIAADRFRTRGRLIFSEHLMPGSDPSLFVGQLVRRHSADRHVLAVGHEPYLTTLAAILIGGGSSMRMNLKKGGLCKLTIHQLGFGRCAELNWLLTPRQLVDLGRAIKS